MAGHSKFKNIMHRKGAQDKKRAKIFSKLGREITVAAKMGGGDPDANPRLRLAISAAKSQSMPKDRIERAIETGAGGTDTSDYFEIRYEGYGPGGTAIIVDALSDNRNRTAGEVRAAFSKNGGNLGETGSVAFMFDKIGQLTYKADEIDGDEIFEIAAEAGADNVESTDDGHEVTTSVEDFGTVRDALEAKYGEAENAGLIWVPQNTVEVSEKQAETLLKMIDALEDLDDVQNVYSNFEIDDEIMERLIA
ncbi:MAG: YebC/PmpR family DNA-binding transcriptional regulator [Alphaproteobacteria bacterium]